MSDYLRWPRLLPLPLHARYDNVCAGSALLMLITLQALNPLCDDDDAASTQLLTHCGALVQYVAPASIEKKGTEIPGTINGVEYV